MKVSLFIIFMSFMTAALAVDYQLVKGHTDVNFSVKHMLISNTRGVFREFTGEFKIDERKKELSNLNVQIQANSIFTNDNERDTHLKKSDFLDVEKYPVIEFKIENLKYVENKPIKTQGLLTIRSVQKSIPLIITFTGFKVSPFDSKTYGGFSLKTTINRKDFGMTFNKTLDQGGVAIDNNVLVDISGEFVQKN